MPSNVLRLVPPAEPVCAFDAQRQGMLRAFADWADSGATQAELAEEIESTLTALRCLAALKELQHGGR